MARPVGVDISKYQGNNLLTYPNVHGVNFTVLHNKSDFIVMRAGYGGSTGGAWLDERVHQFMDDLAPLLRQEPKPFTFYWFFRDDVNIMDQVNLFSSVINKYKDVVNLPPVVDAEVFVKDHLLSTQKIIDFQTEVENQTGLKVDILYGRAAQLNSETIPGLEVVLPHLWIARYADFLDEQVNEPWDEGSNVAPRDYDDWKFWQYSSKGPGGQYGVVSASIDMNVFNGTLDELREWAGLHEPNPPVNRDETFVISQQIGKIANEDVEVTIGADSTLLPRFLEVVSDPGVVRYVTVYSVIDGKRIQFARKYMGYTGWTGLEIPNWVELKDGTDIVVSLDGRVDGLVEVNLVVEDWGL